jgi:hypothetical protein
VAGFGKMEICINCLTLNAKNVLFPADSIYLEINLWKQPKETTNEPKEMANRLCEMANRLCEMANHLCEMANRLCEMANHLCEMA